MKSILGTASKFGFARTVGRALVLARSEHAVTGVCPTQIRNDSRDNQCLVLARQANGKPDRNAGMERWNNRIRFVFSACALALTLLACSLGYSADRMRIATGGFSPSVPP